MRREQCEEIAESFWSAYVYTMVADGLTTESSIAQIMNIKREIARRAKVPTGSEVAPIVYLNHTAPSLVEVPVKKVQFALLGWLLNDNMQNVGLALLPVHVYKKGTLHAEETTLIGDLAKRNHNLDHAFSVSSAEANDARDQRPLVPHPVLHLQMFCKKLLSLTLTAG